MEVVLRIGRLYVYRWSFSHFGWGRDGNELWLHVGPFDIAWCRQ